MNEENKISIVNNEYDYSTAIVTSDAITYLVQYCDGVYKNFMALVDEDKKRNEQFKQESNVEINVSITIH